MNPSSLIAPVTTAPDTAESLMLSNQPLTANDRCDRCGAQAYLAVAVGFDGKTGDLLFCAHHAREHRTALGLKTTVIRDEQDKLLAMEGGNRQQGAAHA